MWLRGTWWLPLRNLWEEPQGQVKCPDKPRNYARGLDKPSSLTSVLWALDRLVGWNVGPAWYYQAGMSYHRVRSFCEQRHEEQGRLGVLQGWGDWRNGLCLCLQCAEVVWSGQEKMESFIFVCFAFALILVCFLWEWFAYWICILGERQNSLSFIHFLVHSLSYSFLFIRSFTIWTSTMCQVLGHFRHDIFFNPNGNLVVVVWWWWCLF